jgi:hypothetical protein
VEQEKLAPPTPKTASQPTIFVPPHQLQLKLPANAIMKMFRAFFSTVHLAPNPVNLSPGFLFLPTHGASRATLGPAPPLIFSRLLLFSRRCSSPGRCSSPTILGHALTHVAHSSSPAPRRPAPASTKEHCWPHPARVSPQAGLLYEGSSFFA